MQYKNKKNTNGYFVTNEILIAVYRLPTNKCYFCSMKIYNTLILRQEMRAVLRLGIPLMIAELSGVLMSLIGTAMVGGVSTTAVAAAGIARPVYLFFALFGIGSAVMTAPLVAIANEQSDKTAVKNILYFGGAVGVLLSLVLCGMTCVIAAHFDYLQQPPDVTAAAVPYLWAIIPSIFPLLLSIHLLHFADGLGHTRVGMVFAMSSLVLNFMLCWVFIFGNLGAKPLGLLGAGIATTVSEYALFSSLLYYIYTSEKFAAVHQARIVWVRWRTEMSSFASAAFPVGLQIWVEYLAYAGAAMIVGQLGTYPLAAHNIAINLASSSFMLMLAIGTAGSIRVGQAVGQNDNEQARLSGVSALVLGLLFISIFVALFLCFPSALARIFTRDEQVVQLIVPLLITAGFFQLCDAVQCVSIALLRGLGDSQLPSAISLAAYWLIGMPIGYWLTFGFGWGVQGVWIGFLISLSLQAVWFTWRFFHLTRKA